MLKRRDIMKETGVKKKKKWPIVLLIILVIIGLLFRLMHWPGGITMLIAGAVFPQPQEFL